VFKAGESTFLEGASILGTERGDRSLQLQNKSVSPRGPAVKFLHKRPTVDAENYSPVKAEGSLDISRQTTTEKMQKLNTAPKE